MTPSRMLAEAASPPRPAPPAEPAPHTLRVVSLFSGAGGFDLGFEMAGGYTSVFSNEVKQAPADTFARHFFGSAAVEDAAPVYEGRPIATCRDVAHLDFSGLKGVDADVLIGGPPCQDFSVMKGQNRQGTTVHRGQLYVHYVRALALLQPRAFVFENVPGLMSAEKGRAWETIKADLMRPAAALREVAREDPSFADAAAAARDEPYVLLYADNVDLVRIGVPQTRRRLIVVGIRQDVASAMTAYDFAVAKMQFRERMKGGRTKFPTFPLTCLEVFEGRPLNELQHVYREVMEGWRPLADEMPRRESAESWRRELDEMLTLDVRKDYLLRCGLEPHILEMFESDFDEAMEEHARLLQSLGYHKPVSALESGDGSNRVANETGAVRARMRMIPPGRNYEFVDETKWEVAGKGLSLIYRRPFPLEPAPTVVAFGGGGTYAYHYSRGRSMLTSRERARVQTFTDDFLFAGDAHEVRAQIGEAVPPLLARCIAEELKNVLV